MQVRLTDDERRAKGEELAALLVRKRLLETDFAEQRSAHNADMKHLTERITTLAREVDTGYTDAVQVEIPTEPAPEVQVGSGPDMPTAAESLANVMAFVRRESDGEPEDTTEEAVDEREDLEEAGPGDGGE